MRLCLVTALLMCGCSGDHRVPQHEERDEPELETQVRFEPVRSQPVEPGTAVSVEGAPLPGELRALLPLDLDDDGDRDALAVGIEQRQLSVQLAHRDEGSFRVRRVGELALEEGCTVEDAGIETVSPEHAFARASISCPDGEAWKAWWVVTLGASPRLHETISLRGEGTVTLALEDHDDDGHPDLRADVDLGSGPLSLWWFDRPSGLARESGEPAASLEAMSQNDEERARATALIDALCADAAPRFRLGRSHWGLDCPDALTRRARDARALGLLDGDLRAAVAALPAPPLDEALRSALEAKATRAIAHRITRWDEPATLATRHVMLAFSGNDLIVRGVEAQLYRAAALSPPTDVVPADAHPAPVSDPQHAFFVQSVNRDCNGLELRLLPHAQLRASAFVAPRSVRAFEAPLEDCTSADEWRALGWAPQGVVVASLESRRTLPLSLEALPLGEAVELADDALPPAPLNGGRITPDGSVWIWETPHGVLRMGERTELWRTAEWSTAHVTAAAISDDGAAIAILQSGTVSVLRRETP